MTRVLSSIVVFFLLASCSATRNLPGNGSGADTSLPKNSEDSALFIAETYQQIQEKKINFNTFSAKINVDYKEGETSQYNVNAFVRMKKDSVIWISVNAIFGIEAMRMLVTKDSVKLLDKQNQLYTARSIWFLYDLTGLPLDLGSMQDLLLGNPVYFGPEIAAYGQNKGELSLLSMGTIFRNLSIFNGSNLTLLRSRLDDADPMRNMSTDLFYNNYQTSAGKLFSHERRLLIHDEKKLEIKMDFKSVDFNEELTFPFSIPQNYNAN